MDSPQTLPPGSVVDSVEPNTDVLPKLLPLLCGIMICLFACYIIIRGIRNSQQVSITLSTAWTEEPVEDEQPLEKRIADIESKLIIRKVLKVKTKQTDDAAEQQEDDGSDEEEAASGWMDASGRLYSNIKSSFYASGSNQQQQQHHDRIEFSAPINGYELNPNDETDNIGDVESGEATRIGAEPGSEDPNHGGTPCVSPVGEAVAVEAETPSEKERRPSMQQQQQKQPTLLRKLSSSLGLSSSSHHHHNCPTTCDICLTDYEVGDEVAWSKNDVCRHAFHKECIRDWLLRRPDCPLCRQNYLVDTSTEAQE